MGLAVQTLNDPWLSAHCSHMMNRRESNRNAVAAWGVLAVAKPLWLSVQRPTYCVKGRRVNDPFQAGEFGRNTGRGIGHHELTRGLGLLTVAKATPTPNVGLPTDGRAAA